MPRKPPNPLAMIPSAEIIRHALQYHRQNVTRLEFLLGVAEGVEATPEPESRFFRFMNSLPDIDSIRLEYSRNLHERDLIKKILAMAEENEEIKKLDKQATSKKGA